MTVASSQPTIRAKVYDFFAGGNKPTTALAVMRNYFNNLEDGNNRKNLIAQLNSLEDEPKQIRALLLTDKGKENKQALELLDEMIRSGDDVVSQKALKIFTQYLERSVTRQNAMGTPRPDLTKAESAFTQLTEFITQTSDDKKQQLALGIANSCGYLYQKDGDDRTSTTWRRGQIDVIGKPETDPRLFNFFEGLKTTEAGKMLHRLAVDMGLQEIHEDLGNKHIAGEETSLSDQVRASLEQQTRTASYSTNPLSLWGDKSLTQTISSQNAQETSFLNSYKKSADFEFSIANIESKLIKATKPEHRKEIILDFVAAFELLSFRKANLMEAGKLSQDILLTRQAKRIEVQQEQMMQALQQYAGRDEKVATAINDLFQANGASILMFHMKGAIATTDRAVASLVRREVDELIQDYGASSVALSSGKNVDDSLRDFATLQKETEAQVTTQSKTLATRVLGALGQPNLLDQAAISNFERFIGITFSSDVTDWSFRTMDDEARHNTIIVQHPGTAYFGLNQALVELENHINTSTDPSIIHVRKNFERIYGIDLNEMLTRLKNQERPNKSDGEDRFIFDSADKVRTSLTAVAEDARKTQANLPTNFEFEHAVTRPGFHTDLKNILDGQSTLTQEKIIAEIVNNDTKAHHDAGFNREESGHLQRLLLSPEIDDKALQVSERAIGIAELERRILNSTYSDTEKASAINYIHRELLKDTSFRIQPDLATYRTTLNAALGNTDRDYASIIADGSPSQFGELLKTRYKADDLSISNGKIRQTALNFMRRESNLLVDGFNGVIPEGLFFAKPEATLEILENLREKVQAAYEQNNPELESEALQEMMQAFRDIGMPIDKLIKADTLADGTWKDDFIFADPLLSSPGSAESDIMRIFVEIWNSILRSLDIKK